MPTTVEREWAVVYDEEVITKRDNRGELLEWLEDSMYSRSTVEVIALPTTHTSLLI